MTKWEYGYIVFGGEDVANREAMDRRGDEGWELVSVDNGIAYFRRPKAISVRIGPSESKAPSEAPSV